MTNQFVHLHNHSDASLLDGFGKLEEYIARVVEIGQPGLGISDHGSTSNVYSLINQARAAGIVPVPGCEFYLAPQNPEGAKRIGSVFYGKDGLKAPEYDVSSNGAYTHQTIWAVNNTGLKNLFKLSTMSNDPDRYFFKPRIDFEMLAEHSEGLVVATGCPSSEISTRLLLGQKKEAYEYANRMKEVFGDRMFVEIMEHDMNTSLERKLLPMSMELARKMNLPLLATNDAHYTRQTDVRHHEEMLCSQSGSRMKEETWDNGGKRFAFDGNQFYLKTADEMHEIFPEEDYPGAIKNTLLIAEMASEVSLDFDPTLKPTAIIPPGYDELSFFKKLIKDGFEERYGNMDREYKTLAKERVDKEFEIIHSSNFVGYFLTVWEYLNWTRETYSTKNPAGDIIALPIGVGRGSSGGSIIAYVLKITEIDPLRYDTLFERFLSEGRGDIYEIEYEDGTKEKVVVSDNKQVKNEDGKETKKYIHQLSVGDAVLIEEQLLNSEPEIVVEKAKLATISTTPDEVLVVVNNLGPIPTEKLSDLSQIPF